MDFTISLEFAMILSHSGIYTVWFYRNNVDFTRVHAGVNPTNEL